MENERNDDIVIYRSKDIQSMFGFGKNKVNELMKSSAFPAIKLGGEYIVEKNALKKWLTTNQGRSFSI